MNTITINNQLITQKEYKGTIVVTFKDIDSVHQRPYGTARRNFNSNKKYFIEGTDYFVRNSYEAKKEYGITAPNGIILLTESGYLMIVKSFTDELSWTVQRMLVNTYFRTKQAEQLPLPTALPEKAEYIYFDKTWCGVPVLTATDVVHLTGVGVNTVTWYARRHMTLNTDYYFLEKSPLREFKKENPQFNKSAAQVVVLNKTGFTKFCKAYGVKMEQPKCFDAPKPEPKPEPSQKYIADETLANTMQYIRRDLKGIEALTYLLETPSTMEELEIYQKKLEHLLKSLAHWHLDTNLIMTKATTLYSVDKMATDKGRQLKTAIEKAHTGKTAYRNIY